MSNTLNSATNAPDIVGRTAMSKIDKIEQSLATKSQRFWEEMRTNIALAERSEAVDQISIDQMKKELSDILDYGILNYPQTMLDVGLEHKMPLKERKAQLGISLEAMDHNEDEKRFLRNMAYKADNTRKGNWKWRIAQEAEEKQEEGWHPFFVTLTVDPKKADPKEIWTNTNEFRKYIRKLVNIVCKELGHKPAHKTNKSESEYVTYAGVIEHGKSREHHHGHFIIWLRAIPATWRVCPNAGIKNPAARTRNECLPMRTLWTWSSHDLSPALYFRSVGDVWSMKYNFCLPLKEGRPMKVSVPRTAGHYITKYLSKEHKEWNHRMKATRNLGMNKLKTLLRLIDPKVVEALSWRPVDSNTNTSLMQIHTVPIGLVRLEAKRQNYLNMFRQNRLDLKMLLESNSGIFSRMLSSVRSGARPDRMDSSEFYDWVGEHLPEQKGYSRTRILIAHTMLGTVFPVNNCRIQSIKIGANNSGYS